MGTRHVDPSRELGVDAVRSWRARALAPLALIACNAFGIVLTESRIRTTALACAHILVLTLAVTYSRVRSSGDTVRTAVVPVADGSDTKEEITHMEYDRRCVSQLASSSLVALVTAWLLHTSGLTTNLLVLQCILLPTSVFDAEVVRLHLWREDPSRLCFQRPFRSEPEKLVAAYVPRVVCFESIVTAC